MRKAKKSTGKKVNYEIIPRKADHGREPYKLLDELVTKHHPHLTNARIGMAWHVDVKADVDGHIMLGKCVKVSDLQKEFAEYDFIIVLNRQVWYNSNFDSPKKAALVDHELCHAEMARDKDGEDKTDERGRPVYRVRKHDIEEFTEIIRRHGCYKVDLEIFAKALLARKDTLFPDEPAKFTPTTKEAPKGLQ